MVYRIILYRICLSARMACNDSVIVPMRSLERKKNARDFRRRMRRQIQFSWSYPNALCTADSLDIKPRMLDLFPVNFTLCELDVATTLNEKSYRRNFVSSNFRERSITMPNQIWVTGSVLHKTGRYRDRYGTETDLASGGTNLTSIRASVLKLSKNSYPSLNNLTERRAITGDTSPSLLGIINSRFDSRATLSSDICLLRGLWRRQHAVIEMVLTCMGRTCTRPNPPTRRAAAAY